MSTRSPVTFAQISDCHLYADKQAIHYDYDVFANLCEVLSVIKKNKIVEFIIFTGDLTQDHSEQSYLNFVNAVNSLSIELPIYFLAGNHDDEEQLHRFLKGKPFDSAKVIELAHWNINLINSKSESPAGFIDCQKLDNLFKANGNTDKLPEKFQLLMMHHHAIDVGYFIDKHGLTNKAEFWQHLAKLKSVRAIACGHIHNALTILPEVSGYSVPLYTCPATSIQFDKTFYTVKNANKGAGFRIFTLYDNGDIDTQAHFIEPKGLRV